MSNALHAALSVAVGLALAAACGLRVFVPLLALSLAARAELLPLAPGFEWIATDQAAVAFGSATVFEVAAYYLPWLDHLLDLAAAPAATLAGVVVAASVLTELPPFLRWTLAVVAGGGAAGVVQGATTVTRLKSTAFTAGFGNPVLATAELAGAVAASALAVVAPAATLAVLLLGGLLWARRWRRRGPTGQG